MLLCENCGKEIKHCCVGLMGQVASGYRHAVSDSHFCDSKWSDSPFKWATPKTKTTEPEINNNPIPEDVEEELRGDTRMSFMQ